MSLFGLSLSPLSLRLTDKLCKANKSINVLYTCTKFTSTSRSFLLSATTLSERLNKSFLGGKVKWDTYKKVINKYWFQTDESKEKQVSLISLMKSISLKLMKWQQSLLLLEISFSYPDGVVEIYYIACICSKHLLQ